jgi:hypothetical protein
MEKLNFDEMFRCFFCGYMVDEPHESECCGKLYCQSCVVELTFSQCRLCKKAVKLRKNLFAKKLLERVELNCRYHCGKKLIYEEMKMHIYRCESRIYKCSIDICNFVGRKYEMIPHMIESHEAHLLIMLENYEEFQDQMEKIEKNPIDKRSPKKIKKEIFEFPPSLNLNDQNEPYDFRYEFNEMDNLIGSYANIYDVDYIPHHQTNHINSNFDRINNDSVQINDRQIFPVLDSIQPRTDILRLERTHNVYDTFSNHFNFRQNDFTNNSNLRELINRNTNDLERRSSIINIPDLNDSYTNNSNDTEEEFKSN